MKEYIKKSEELLSLVRERAPLVLNITNSVVTNFSANAILAIGGSPVISNAKEETREVVSQSNSVVINIGTLNKEWLKLAEEACDASKEYGVPVVIDPVGSGFSLLRSESTKSLMLKQKSAVIRCNASEAASICIGQKNHSGVDSSEVVGSIIESVVDMSVSRGTCFCVSGETDVVIKGKEVVELYHGDKIMSKVTGMGCISSAILATFLGVCTAEEDYKFACFASALVMGVCGERAASRSKGTGTFYVNFLDELYCFDMKSISNVKGRVVDA